MDLQDCCETGTYTSDMGFFDRFRRRRRQIPGVTGASARTFAELEQFLRSREGVEGYLEPRTTVYATTLCLVAADGEFLRRPVKDERQAHVLCGQYQVPLYDARKVGYPKRMREYQKGTSQRRISLEDLPPLDVTEERDLDN
jgi:hypothetical protein